jgi:hypothetical protein
VAAFGIRIVFAAATMSTGAADPPSVVRHRLGGVAPGFEILLSSEVDGNC